MYILIKTKSKFVTNDVLFSWVQKIAFQYYWLFFLLFKYTKIGQTMFSTQS